MTGTTQDRATRFFYEQAGYSYDPAKETVEQGRQRGAERLAAAERWLSEQNGHTIEWEIDEGADRSWMDDDDGRPFFQCAVTCPSMGHAVASLCGIDLGKDGSLADPYTRVVVAELALELMPD